MKNSSKTVTEFNLILALIGMSVFVMGLFNKKTRNMAVKVLHFGGGMIADHLAKKYLPVNGYRLAKVVTNYMPLQGSKGGKASKRTFKNNKITKATHKGSF